MGQGKSKRDLGNEKNKKERGRRIKKLSIQTHEEKTFIVISKTKSRLICSPLKFEMG